MKGIYKMNNRRRKQIQNALELINQAKNILEIVKEEEQDAFDSMPENLQYSEKGEKIEENIYTLENFIDFLDDTEELEIM